VYVGFAKKSVCQSGIGITNARKNGWRKTDEWMEKQMNEWISVD